MKRKITITYNWSKNDSGDIKENHKEALEEHAENRILEMTSEGFTSGELSDNIFMNDDDIDENGNEGIGYSGWWERKTETL